MSDRIRNVVLSAVFAILLLQLFAPALSTMTGIEVSGPLGEDIPGQQDDWDQLNDVQRKALVDLSRKTSSQNYFFHRAGGTLDDVGNAVTVDSNGDAYFAGSFRGAATFGSTALGSAGEQDIFVAKLSSYGSWIWAVRAGGAHGDEATGIAVDSSGDVFVTGNYCSANPQPTNCSGDVVAFGSHNLLGSEYQDAFVAKLNGAGSWLWVVGMAASSQSSGNTPSSNYGTDIAVDSSGDAYITGSFSGANATFGAHNLTNEGGSDIFVAKMSNDGAWMWASMAGGSSDDVGFGIAVDSNGSAYVTGIFDSVVVFGSTVLASSGAGDAFVAKLASNGSWLWAVAATGSYESKGNAIALDPAGDAYVTGYIRGPTATTFGSIQVTGYGAYDDLFIAKVNSSGSWIWALSGGGPWYDQGYGITVDGNGDAYLIGSYCGEAEFGGVSLHGAEYFVSDIFVAKVSSAGTLLWAIDMVGVEEDGGRAITVDPDGKLTVTGYFDGSLNLAEASWSSGSSEAFVLSLNSNLSTISAFSSTFSINGTSSRMVNAIAAGPGDSAYIVGYFSGTIDFGGGTSITSDSSRCVFAAKLSSTGSWDWAVRGGTVSTTTAVDIAVDSNGNAFITGAFWSTSNFGTSILQSAGSEDIFVAKISNSGSWEWAVRAGGASYDGGEGIAVSSSGDVFVTGYFYGYASFKHWGIGSIGIQSTGTTDIFAAKIDSMGSWQWVKNAGGTSADYGKSIAADDSGNAFVTGRFLSTATFGSASITSAGSYDIFVAKISSSGSWSSNLVRAGGTLSDSGTSITVDSRFAPSKPHISGYFGGTANFGSSSLTSSGGTHNVFVAKSSSYLTWEWAVNLGLTPSYEESEIDIDSNGASYVAGTLENNWSPGNANLNITSPNIFAAKIDSEGSLVWEIMAGSQGGDYSTGIALDSQGNAHLTGVFSSQAQFGRTTLFTGSASSIFVTTLYPDTDGDSTADLHDDFVLESTQQTDQDGDGYGDDLLGHHGDACPSVFGASWQDRWGCPDLDGDGQSDLFDAYFQNPTQWNDTDNDGRGDNWDGVTVDRNGSSNGIGEYWPNAHLPDLFPLDYDNDGFDDASLQASGASEPYDDCPLVYGFSIEDRSGCIDSDGDRWSDDGDSHPGDGTQHSDIDDDGFGDNPIGNLPDGCPNTAGNSTRDVYGCSDLDGDGYSSLSDFDDSDASEWSDADGDGIGDNGDACPYQAGNIAAGSSEQGCPDVDDDGVSDLNDAFSEDPTQSADGDGDGYGDNPDGLEPDACPNQAGTSTLGGFGCQDTDRDGWGDAFDAFPADPTQWADADGDGYGDSDFGRDPDACVEVSGNSSQGDILGCVDSDGDGWADSIDAFVADPTKWGDSDGDGFADQADDDCPYILGYSQIPWRGCPDMDGDGIMDLADDDIDGDNISNVDEVRVTQMFYLSEEYDPYDASSTPGDHDGDRIPDDLDDDIDNDGFTNKFELERGSDPWDDTITPFNKYGGVDTGWSYIPGYGFVDYVDEDDDGYEISLSAFINILTSEFLIPILTLPLVIILAGRKRRRFKRLRDIIEQSVELLELEDIEEELDELIGGKRLKINDALLLRNSLERRQDYLRGHTHDDMSDDGLPGDEMMFDYDAMPAHPGEVASDIGESGRGEI